MRVFFLGFLFSFALFGYDDPYANDNRELGKKWCDKVAKSHFVGCRPSPGECKNSCATRKMHTIVDKDWKVCDKHYALDRSLCCCR